MGLHPQDLTKTPPQARDRHSGDKGSAKKFRGSPACYALFLGELSDRNLFLKTLASDKCH